MQDAETLFPHPAPITEGYRLDGVTEQRLRTGAEAGAGDCALRHDVVLVDAVAADADPAQQQVAGAIVNGLSAREGYDSAVATVGEIIARAAPQGAKWIGIAKAPQWRHTFVGADIAGGGRAGSVLPGQKA